MGRPGRSLGSSAGVPDAPRWCLWGGLGWFWGPLGRTVAKKVARVNRTHGFGSKNCAKRVPQGPHFGGQNRYKIASKFGSDSGNDFLSSRAPPEAKKLYFHWKVVQNRRSAFLPPSAPEVDFWHQFGSHKGPKIMKKRGRIFNKNRKRKKSPKRAPKVAPPIIGTTMVGPRGPSGGGRGGYNPSRKTLLI